MKTTFYRFRPLAGIMVLISNQKWPDEKGAGKFRPLAGIMVLISMAVCSALSALEYNSVPLRGLWFLSLTFS